MLNIEENLVIKRLLNEIEELEEFVERLVLTNKISYDEDFHGEVIKRYSDIMKKIKHSEINNDWKYILSDSVFDTFIQVL